jgi:hypothetical protein
MKRKTNLWAAAGACNFVLCVAKLALATAKGLEEKGIYIYTYIYIYIYTHKKKREV